MREGGANQADVQLDGCPIGNSDTIPCGGGHNIRIFKVMMSEDLRTHIQVASGSCGLSLTLNISLKRTIVTTMSLSSVKSLLL